MKSLTSRVMMLPLALSPPLAAWASDECSQVQTLLTNGPSFQTLRGTPLGDKRWSSTLSLLGLGQCEIAQERQSYAFRCEATKSPDGPASTTFADSTANALQQCLGRSWTIASSYNNAKAFQYVISKPGEPMRFQVRLTEESRPQMVDGHMGSQTVWQVTMEATAEITWLNVTAEEPRELAWRRDRAGFCRDVKAVLVTAKGKFASMKAGPDGTGDWLPRVLLPGMSGCYVSDDGSSYTCKAFIDNNRALVRGAMTALTRDLVECDKTFVAEEGSRDRSGRTRVRIYAPNQQAVVTLRERDLGGASGTPQLVLDIESPSN